MARRRRMIAVLFADRDGSYAELPRIDLWHEGRDARRYAGPWPVVAHPPCGRWCQLAGLVEHRWGHRVGDDGGCFAAALAAVRRYGGVLEHPAYTLAWPEYGLLRPPYGGGWQQGTDGGWVCHVEQGLYGHPARKATWLYAHGVTPLPLRWGRAPKGRALVGWCANRIDDLEGRPRIDRRTAAATPPMFREALLALAATAHLR